MRSVIGFSILTAFAAPLPAQQASVCSMLTPAEIQAVTGAASDAGTPNDLSAAKGITTHTCMYSVPTEKGMLTVALGPKPAGMSATAIAKKNPGVDALRAQHWIEEAKEYGSTYCSLFSSPPTQKQPMSLTACTGEAKGQVVSLTWMTPGKKMSLDEAKSLFDKAIPRVP